MGFKLFNYFSALIQGNNTCSEGTLTGVQSLKLRGVLVQELLDQLSSTFEVLRKEGVAPAISNEEFQRLITQLPFTLPSELEQIYRWHDGVKEIIPAYDFLSLADAIVQYEELISFGEDEQDEDFFNKNHFPIFQFDGDYFSVDCTPDSEKSIYYFSYESETVKTYECLEQLFHIIADAYLSRAYYIEDGMVLENPVLLRKIEKKYWSQDQLAQKEAEWDRLLIAIHEIKNPDSSQERSAEKVQLRELSAILGLASPADMDKESLIRRLTETYDERATIFLVDFLNDKNSEVIAKAASGLGTLRAREYLSELIQLTKHSAEVVRNLSTHAIANMVSPNDQLLVEPIIELLSDDAVLVRIAAVEALGQLRNTTTMQPLIPLIQDKNSGVRYRAIQALGKIGDVNAIEFLQQRRIDALPQEVRMIEQAIHSIEKANSTDSFQ